MCNKHLCPSGNHKPVWPEAYCASADAEACVDEKSAEREKLTNLQTDRVTQVALMRMVERENRLCAHQVLGVPGRSGPSTLLGAGKRQ